MENFNGNIFCERAIKKFGKTGQKELAAMLNVSQSVISDIVNKNVKAPRADTVFSIAKAFGVSADWLLGLTDVETTGKATKELCATLGLSEQSIECLQDNTDEYAKKSIDWLVKQHIESIADKVKEAKFVLERNKGASYLTDISKDVLSKQFGILDNSILFNLYSLLSLDNEHADIIFRVCENFVNFSAFNNEKALAPKTVEFNENEIKLPVGVFTCKGIVCETHKRSIFKEIELLIDKIMENQYSFNFDKSIELFKETLFNGEGEG